MRNQNSTLFIFMAAAVMAVTFFSCSEHKGFKKDKESGLYYKFYEQNDTAPKVEDGGLVVVDFIIRNTDSVFNQGRTVLHIEEPSFKGDMITAFKMMHQNDSATFIFQADTFFKYYMPDLAYTQKDKNIYFDVKMLQVLSKEQFETMQQNRQKQIDAMKEQYRMQEDSLIQLCLKATKITTKPAESGLYIKTLKAGKGDAPKAGQTVAVHYTGKFADGVVFDSSIERGEPYTFTLGQGMVIPGWDEAIATMKMGEKAVLVIPSKLAYGEGNQGIPPYTPLIFEVELIGIQ
ncbi:MAG: FKBP-type peptidyl-prolyl cis-trans isomerase [Bacteroidales bacterium]|jgi:FKBP-type peptidyl-prolyl cis-trans isomerase|nr:FKBP-type peptidyl-prolyl cis-trans isomerase [Bacteroidales bacterium]